MPPPIGAFEVFRVNCIYKQEEEEKGHIITHNLIDDNDIQREIRSMFVRCNILIRKFSRCSEHVKLKLYQAYCLCFMILLYGLRLMLAVYANSARVITNV